MNWLGFSLSTQELASQTANQDHSGLGFSSDEISGTDVSGDCCYITSDDSAAHSLSLPPPFGILEAFNRNNNNTQQDREIIEWAEIKGMGSNREKYKMSMVMGGSSSCSREQEPKLENLMGRHSAQSYGEEVASSASGLGAVGVGGGGTVTNTSSIGLSMIKTWLRNQPTHPHHHNETSESESASATAHTQTHTLSLSMSTGSSSSPVLPLLTPNGAAPASSSPTTTQTPPPIHSHSTLPRKSIDTFGQRTSIYRGVTRHRWTGRYEAHLWDNSCRREGQTRKGRQVYLGGYDKEEKAARAYDLAALKYWGTTTTTNFPICNYEEELEEMKHMTRQEYVASLRRKSSGFSRGASIYRGVTRHHQHGRWQARIGRVAGNKDLYLGTFSTQEEAAEAYDIAAIKFRGLNAVTNFDMSRYDVKSILESTTLPIGGAAKRLKDVEHAQVTTPSPSLGDICHLQQHHHSNSFSNVNSNTIICTDSPTWPPTLPFHPPYTFHYPYGHGHGQLQRLWCKQEQDSDSHHHDTAFTFHQDLIHHHDFLQSNNSNVYADADASNYGYVGGYLTPPPTDAIANHNQRSIANVNCFGDSASAYQTILPSADPQHHASSRNLYYISPAADGAVKASAFDQTSAWVPTAIPTLAPRSSNMPLCSPPPPFSLFHDQ